jgi:O-antigen/teichoic acid export membrane protein
VPNEGKRGRFRRPFAIPAITGSLIWSGSASVIAQGSTLLLTLILSNLLGPANLARYYVTQNTIQTLSNVAQAGLSFTATNYVARHRVDDPGRASAIITFALAATLAGGAAIGAGLLLLAGPIASGLYGDASLAPFLTLAIVAFPFAALGLVQIAILTGLEQFRLIAGGAAAQAALLLAAVFVGAFAAGPLGAALGLAAATLLRAAIMQILVGRARRALPAPSLGMRKVWKEIRHFALPAGLAGLTMMPALWITNALLVNSQSLTALGLFSTAFTVKMMVTFVPVQIGTVFLPRYVAAHQRDARTAHRQLNKAILVVFMISATLGGLGALLSPAVMSVFGPRFAEGAGALRWLMLVAVIESVASITSYRLAGEERMWWSFLCYTAPKDMLLVLASIILIPGFGAIGLAWAHLASWSYALAALFFISRRLNR